MKDGLLFVTVDAGVVAIAIIAVRQHGRSDQAKEKPKVEEKCSEEG